MKSRGTWCSSDSPGGSQLLELLTIAALTLGLEPAKVSVTQCSKTDATWSITAPKTAPFNTPRFNFSATSSDFAAPAGDLTWTATGSLGLPHHPLGIVRRRNSAAQFCCAIL